MTTRTTDIQGRPYTKLSTLKPGDTVIVDEGFICMKGWTERKVFADPSDYRPGKELYIKCRSGQHSLEGQLEPDNDTLVGIYKKD